MLENHDTFFARLEPYFSPSQLRKIELAYVLAKYYHRAQNRNEVDDNGERVRYFEHVRRSALISVDVAKIVRTDTIIASVLHDSLEDTRISSEMIEDCFGAEVCSIVKVLTKKPKDGYIDRLMICSDWRPYFVKACDRLDNLNTLKGCDKKFIEKQLHETEEKYYRLFDRMETIAPPEYSLGLHSIRLAIQQAVTENWTHVLTGK